MLLPNLLLPIWCQLLVLTKKKKNNSLQRHKLAICFVHLQCVKGSFYQRNSPNSHHRMFLIFDD